MVWSVNLRERVVSFAAGTERKSLRVASLASRMAFGVCAIALAIVIRIPLEPILQGRNTFLVLEPAIAVAAWYGGLVSGGTATVTAIVAAVLLYLDPVGSFGIRSDGDFVSLVLFSGNGIVLTYLSSGLRNSFQRATRSLLAAEEIGRPKRRPATNRPRPEPADGAQRARPNSH